MHHVNQIQQILQLQQLRQQQQQALQQQNNRQQIQIFASPPNTNHVTQLANNNVSNASNPTTALFQIQPTSSANPNPTNDTASNGIQIQPLQILQMTQNNATNAANPRTTPTNTAPHNPNTHRQNSVQTVNARPISVTATTTPLSSINLSSIPHMSQIRLIHQFQQRQRAQQQAAQQAQALQQHHHQQQQQQQQHNSTVSSNGGNAQFRQSIQQQMVAFIQQLQQFPPLFQHLQSNPQVLAQLLQQFKCKQEQNARDMQQRQQLPQQGNMGNIQSFGAMNMAGMASTQHIGALLRNIQAQRQQQQQQAVAAQQAQAQQTQNSNPNIPNTIAAIQSSVSNSNGGRLPALENDNASANGNGNGGRNKKKSDANDDLIILNDTDTDVNNSTHSNMSMNANTNANNSNVTNVGVPSMSEMNNAHKQLDFSQLKTMKIPIVEGGKKTKEKTTSSPLKRPFSMTEEKEERSESLPPSKRRRLNVNNDSYPSNKTITISSDDNSTQTMESSSNYNKKVPSVPRKKKKRGRPVGSGRKKKKEIKAPQPMDTTAGEENTSTTNNTVSLLSDGGSSAPSFKDIVDKAKSDGDQDVIGDEDDTGFVNDPLISQIATKMFEIRQFNNNRRVATPEATGKISKGLDVLLQAIDEMSDDHTNKESNAENKRKNGELFVIDDRNTKERQSVHKIKAILSTNYDHDNFFKLNEHATFLANSTDMELKRGLKELAQQFTHHYNNGLLNVFKTCTHPLFKHKFMQCTDTKHASIDKYYSVWHDIFKQHIMCPIDAWLNHHKIKNALGLMFALIDHLFSHSMYTHLSGSKNAKPPIKTAPSNQLESDKWIRRSGNLLFVQFESNKECIESIANTHMLWLFEYWKKVLLQSQEPVKCLCRSYLTNSAPNPYKNRLYAMVAQTPHAPYTAVVPIKSKSASPFARADRRKKENKHYKNKAKTPPNTTMGHFIRRNTGTMSINGIIKGSGDKNKNIPSSSVCGKTFTSATQCAEHAKDCKQCNHRILTIQSNV
eukprot:33788_1